MSSKRVSLTKSMRGMLVEFARGADVNLTAQLAQLAGRRQEQAAARTILALLKAGMLQHSKSGGLEISDAGRALVADALRGDEAGRDSHSTAASVPSIAGVALPAGWRVNDRLTNYLTIEFPNAGAVTVDLRFRCFRGGYNATRWHIASTKTYTGRGWKAELIADAIQWLSDVYTSKAQP